MGFFLSLQTAVKCLCHGQKSSFVVVNLFWVGGTDEWGTPYTVASHLSEFMLSLSIPYLHSNSNATSVSISIYHTSKYWAQITFGLSQLFQVVFHFLLSVPSLFFFAEFSPSEMTWIFLANHILNQFVTLTYFNLSAALLRIYVPQ